MLFWIIFCLIALLPIIVVCKRRNLWTLLLTFPPFLLYTIYDIRMECLASNNHSEACVWGYLNYMIAIIAGSAFYLLVSMIQYGLQKLRAKSKDVKARKGKLN